MPTLNLSILTLKGVSLGGYFMKMQVGKQSFKTVTLRGTEIAFKQAFVMQDIELDEKLELEIYLAKKVCL